jgi:hypothetical protein
VHSFAQLCDVFGVKHLFFAAQFVVWQRLDCIGQGSARNAKALRGL